NLVGQGTIPPGTLRAFSVRQAIEQVRATTLRTALRRLLARERQAHARRRCAVRRCRRRCLFSPRQQPTGAGLHKFGMELPLRTGGNRSYLVRRRVLLDAIGGEEPHPVTHRRAPFGQWLWCRGWSGRIAVSPHR